MKYFCVEEDKMRCFLKKVFTVVGMVEEEANICAEGLIYASLRGIDSHGISRLKIYLERLEKGLVNPRPNPVVIKSNGAVSLLDGDNGPGIVVARRAIEISIDKAAYFGIAATGVLNSNHCGALAYYTEYAASKGFIGYMSTNTTATMAPWGGKRPYLGTNPFSIAVPRTKNSPIILDMSSSVVARGKIINSLQKGEKIPDGWALDENGISTNDPVQALKGMVMPLGGPKGYGIALICDILCGVLTGAEFGTNIGSLYKDMNKKQGIGHFCIVINIEFLIGSTRFHQRIEEFCSEIKRIPPRDSVSEILLPGEPERKIKEKRKQGIPISENLYKEFQEIGLRYGEELQLLDKSME